jgi:H+/Cl- antiporter ClcA
VTVDPTELAPPLATKVIETPSPTASASLLGSFRPALSGVVVGALAAISATILLGLFKAIASVTTAIRLESGLPLLVVIMPVAGGAIVGIGRRWWGNGYDQLLAGRPAEVARGVGQFGLAAATIIFGGVAGREEPAIGLTAALVRRAGIVVRQRAVSLRGLVSASVAGGLAAAFGAPFAGLLFAMETVAGRPAAGDVIALIVAAILGAIVGRLLGIAAPLPSGVSPAEPGGWIALLAIAVAALIVGLATTSLIGLLLATLRRIGAPAVAMPAIGGLVVGVLTLVSPAFAGLDPIPPGLLAAGPDPLWLVTAAGRAGALVATLGFGGVGGVIGPIVGIGEALGAGLGALLAPFLPGADASTLALVGGIILLSTVVRAPFAGALLAFEFGADPLLVLVLAALAWGAAEISRRAEPWSIYRVLAAAEERPLGSIAPHVLSTTLVRDLMTTNPPALSPTTTLGEAAEAVRASGEEAPIIDPRGELIGLLGPHDVEVALLATGRETPVLAWTRHEFPTLVPYQTIAQALDEPGIESVAAVPVVDPRDSKRLVGVLRRAQVLEALGLAASGRGSERPSPPAGLPVLELTIADGSPWAGKRLRELRLPREAYLAFLQRGEVRLPVRGDSLLRVGDVLVGFAPATVGETLRAEAAPASG